MPCITVAGSYCHNSAYCGRTDPLGALTYRVPSLAHGVHWPYRAPWPTGPPGPTGDPL